MGEPNHMDPYLRAQAMNAIYQRGFRAGVKAAGLPALALMVVFLVVILRLAR